MKMRTKALAAGIAAAVIVAGSTTAALAVSPPVTATFTLDTAVGSTVTLTNKAALTGGKTCNITAVAQTGTVVNALTFTTPSATDSITSNETATVTGTDHFTVTCHDQTPGGKDYVTYYTVNDLDASTTTIATPSDYYALSTGTATLTATVAPDAASTNAVTWTVVDGTTAAGCTIADSSVGTVAFTSVGTCDVTATAAKAGGYFSSSDTKTITVKDSTTATITATPTEASSYFLVSDSGTAATALTSTVSAGNSTAVYSIDGSATNSAGCTIDSTNTDRVDFTGAGVCTAKVTFADSSDYYLGSTATVVVNVYSVPTITLGDSSFEVYESGSATILSSTSSTGTKGYDVVDAGTANCSVTDGGVLSWTGQGTCTVKATVDVSAGQSLHSAESAAATITVGANVLTRTVTITGYAPKGKKALAIRRANAVKAYLLGLGLTDGTNVVVEYVVVGKTISGTGIKTLRAVVSSSSSLAGNTTIQSGTVYFNTGISSLGGGTRWAKNARRGLGALYTTITA